MNILYALATIAASLIGLAAIAYAGVLAHCFIRQARGEFEPDDEGDDD